SELRKFMPCCAPTWQSISGLSPVSATRSSDEKPRLSPQAASTNRATARGTHRTIQQGIAAGSRARYDFTVRLLVVLLVLGAGIARADVYSWTDGDGVLHFTNLKPSGGKWKKVLDSEPPRGSKAAAQRGSCPRCDKVPSTDTSAERFHRYDQFIYEASQLYRIPVPLIRAVIKVESDYDAHVVSSMDCKGLMQVHPDVEIDMGVQGDVFD